MKNNYSEQFIDKFVKTFFNKLFIPSRIIETAEKKQVIIVLLYMGIILTELKVNLLSLFSIYLRLAIKYTIKSIPSKSFSMKKKAN